MNRLSRSILIATVLMSLLAVTPVMASPISLPFNESGAGSIINPTSLFDRVEVFVFGGNFGSVTGSTLNNPNWAVATFLYINNQLGIYHDLYYGVRWHPRHVCIQRYHTC